MRELLRTRYVGFLFVQLVSTCFNSVHVLLLPYWYMEATGSKQAGGLLFTVEAAVALCVLPFAGVLVDRVSHRKLVVMTELVRAICILALACMDINTPLAVVLGVVGLTSAGAATFFALQQATIKDNAVAKAAVDVQAILSLAQGLSLIGGPAVGAWVAHRWGYRTFFVANAASFVASAASATFLVDGRRRLLELTSYLQDFRDGFAGISRNPSLRRVVILQLLTYLSIGSLGLLFIYLFRAIGFDLDMIARMMAAQGIGMLLGALLARRGIRRFPAAAIPLTLAIGMTLCVLAAIERPSPILSAMLLVAFGCLISIQGILLRTIVQSSATAATIGRSASIMRLSSFSGGFISIGFVAATANTLTPAMQMLGLGLLLCASSMTLPALDRSSR